MNATRRYVFLSAVFGLATAGCATETVGYRDVSGQPEYQMPAASYPIPTPNPKGMVYVMSLGGEPMAAPSGARELFLHLRVAAENKSDTTAWTIAAQDQVVNLGGAPLRPTYAQSSISGPALTLAQGQHGYLDVFYPLPSQGNPGQATLSWQVHRGSEVSAANTSFQLVPSQSADYVEYRPAGVTINYWPEWWWGLGFYSPWWWGPGWGYPYWGWGHGYYGHGWGQGYGRGGWGRGYGHPGGAGGWRGAPPSGHFGGGHGGGGWRGGGTRR
jgi:hypothetical protein